MQRKSISKINLQKELNRRLHKTIDSGSISFGGTTLLAELDADGSNWSKAIFMQGKQEDIVTHAHLINVVITK